MQYSQMQSSLNWSNRSACNHQTTQDSCMCTSLTFTLYCLKPATTISAESAKHKQLSNKTNCRWTCIYIIIYIQHKVIFFLASSYSKYYKCFLNNSTANNPILPISILILRMLQRMSDTKFQEFLKNQRNCAKFNARENPNTIIGFSMDRWRDFVTLTKSTILIH